MTHDHSDGCAGGCGTNDSDNPPCPAQDEKLWLARVSQARNDRDWKALNDLVLRSEAALDTFIAGLDSPNHSESSRRAWCRLFLRDAAMGVLRLPVMDAHALDNAYRERNAVIAALIRTNGWLASIVPAPDAEGWWIVYAETPQGQVSWHVNPVDMRLFDGLARQADPDIPHILWDGHTTDEKYERVAMLGPDPYRETKAAFWVRYRCEMVGCPVVEQHEHGGGQTMRAVEGTQ